jgi:hypothetical protein
LKIITISNYPENTNINPYVAKTWPKCPLLLVVCKGPCLRWYVKAFVVGM